jgi:hypothetical protein
MFSAADGLLNGFVRIVMLVAKAEKSSIICTG